ncbi:phage tail length tape measure family protein [Roseomonas populi]|uniref:Phage tail length tape measure family protein n=1 Tax=Roseomonas populi TaxID=3121582 RepID=A0ABT1X119_9PROT|nr:phage tail length tape measure family protein [Roseomonas pecuniae]MCR0981787.1 phage tail length tape measure family protein [Roseomonas pecuniae]
MAGTTYAFRLQAEGADQVERTFERAATAGKEFQSAADALRDSSTRTAGGLDTLTSSVGRSAAEASRASREIGRWTRELDAAAAANDDLVAARQRAARLEEAMAGLQSRGRQVTEEQRSAVAAARTEYERLRDQSDKTSNSFKLQQYQVQNLTAQVVDLGVQISSGGGILLPLIQQGPQAVDAVGGVRNAVGLLGQVLTPARVATLALGAALVTSVAAAESADRTMLGLQARLRATRADYAEVARQVEDTARKVASTSGISAADARQAGLAIGGARDFSGSQSDLERMVRLSGDLARVLGLSVPEAAEKVAAALRKPAEAARQLAEQDFRTLDEATLRTIERLDNMGRRSEAANLTLDAIAKASSGAARDLTPLQRTMDDLSNSGARAWNSLRPLVEGIGRPIAGGAAGLLGALSGVLERLERIRALIEGSGLLGRILAGDPVTAGVELRDRIVGSDGSLTRGSIGREASTSDIQAAIRAEAQRLGEDAAFAQRIAVQESGASQYRNGSIVTSRAGALGTMQLMPGTASQMGVDATDTADNIRGGLAYIQWLRKFLNDLGRRTGTGDLGADESLVAAAYNAGPGRVQKFLEGRGTLPSETWGYVRATARSGVLTGAADEIGTADERYRAASIRSRERENLEDQISQTRRTLATPGLNAEDQKRYNELLEEQLAKLAALRDPMDQRAQQHRNQVALLQMEEGAARKLLEAEQQEIESARQEGRTPDVAGARARAQELLNAELEVAIDKGRLAREAQERLTAAYLDGSKSAAEVDRTIRAETEAKKTAAVTTGDYAEHVRRLTEEYRLNSAAAADNTTAKNLPAQREQLALLEKEGQLVSLSAEARQTELAVFRERQRVLREGGDPDSGVSQAAQNNIRRMGEMQAANQQLTNSWSEFSRIGENAVDRVTQAVIDGGGKVRDWGTIWKQTITSVGSDLLKLAAINPLANWAFGGTRPTLGGVFSAAGTVGSTLSPMASKGMPVTDTSGNLIGYAGTATNGQQLSGLFNSTPGPTMLQSGYDFSSGFIGRADGWLGTNIGGTLNTPVWEGVGGAPVSVGGAALGAASFAGGAYGLYTGIQNGGPKGLVQGIGGVAGMAGGAAALLGGGGTAIGAATGAAAAGSFASAGTAALGAVGTTGAAAGGAAAGAGAATAAAGGMAGVLGAVATVAPYVAAIAAIVAMFLPAQKPSNREGNSTIDFGDGSVFSGGATGGKFSQENRDAAKSLTDAIGGIADRIETAYGVRLEGRMQVGVGDRDGMYLTRNGRDKLTFTADEKGSTDLLREASKRIVEGVADQLKGAMATTYATVGTGDLDRLLGALDWTSTTYKAFEDNKDPEKPTSYEQEIKAVTDAYEPLIAKAKEYGLALEPISDVMDEQLEAVEKARNSDFEKLLQGYRVTASQLTGGDQTAEALKQFDQARTAAWLALEAQIKDWNLPDADVSKATAGFDRVQDLQRAALQRQTTRAFEDREASAADIRNSLRNAYLEANGDPEVGVLSYTQQRDNEWRALKRQMEDLDFAFGDIVASSEEFNAVTQVNIKALRDKAKAEKDAAETTRLTTEQSALTRIGSVQGTLVDFLNGMNASTASPQNAFTAAQEQFAAEIAKARAAGIQGIDAGRVTSAANTLLSAGSSYLGDGIQGAFLRQSVESQVRSLGAALDLPAFGGQIERAMAPLLTVRDALTSLQQEVTRLRVELENTRFSKAA